MVKFIPYSLKEELINSIEILSFLEGEIEGISLEELKKYNEEDYDVIINEDSLVDILVENDDYPSIHLKQFIEMARNKDEFKINSTYSYARSDTEVYFLLDTYDYSTISLLENTFNPNKYQFSESVLPKSILEKEIKSGALLRMKAK